MLLSDILFDGEYTSSFSPSDVSFTHIVTNTADLQAGCLFVCLTGRQTDSHGLMALAAASGATAILAEDGKAQPLTSNTPVFLVADTHETVATLFYRFYGIGNKRCRFVAVTGTNGKTSTSFILAAILAKSGLSVGVVSTVDILLNGSPLPLTPKEEAATRTMTTPDPAYLYPILCRMADAGADVIVMEASSHALYLKKLFPLRFSLGIFTNLSPEHLDFHKDMEDYLSSKVSLFPLCQTALLNAHSPYTAEVLRRTSLPTVLCGTNEACEARLDAFVSEKLPKRATVSEVRSAGSRGTTFCLTWQGERISCHTRLAGGYNMENAALAITASLILGIPIKTAAEGLSSVCHIPGRLELLTDVNAPFALYIDYAHTEAAMRRVLETVRQFRREGERIVILFGCGGDRDKSKRAKMGTAAETLADFSIVTSDNPRTESPTAIIRDILRGMPDRTKRRVIIKRKDAIEYAVAHAKAGDIILLLGKGHETYEITAQGTRPFDEKKIAADAIALRYHTEESENNGGYPPS